jgi:hypothetical protein
MLSPVHEQTGRRHREHPILLAVACLAVLLAALDVIGHADHGTAHPAIASPVVHTHHGAASTHLHAIATPASHDDGDLGCLALPPPAHRLPLWAVAWPAPGFNAQAPALRAADARGVRGPPDLGLHLASFSVSRR